MIEHNSKETTLRDIIKVFFRHKIVAVVAFIVILTTVMLGLELRTPRYSASVKMLVTGTMQRDLEVARNLGPGSLVATQMAMVKSTPILKRTVEALDLHKRPIDYAKQFSTPVKRILIEHSTKKLKRELERMSIEERQQYVMNDAMSKLNGKIQAFPQGETSMFSINVTDYSPQVAVAIANVVSRSFIIFDIEQQIAELQLTYGPKNETIVKLNNYIEKLEDALDGRRLSDMEAMGPATVKIVSQATWGVPIPMKPNKGMAIALAIIMGIAAGTLLAYVFDYVDQTIKSPQDVKKYLRLPFLGSALKRKTKKYKSHENMDLTSRYARSFQKISNQLYGIMKNSNLKSVVITGIEGSKEDAVTISDLGLYLSCNTDCKVLLIDADLRFSMVSELFGMSDTSGLAEVLEGKIRYEDAVQDAGSNLFVLPAGKTSLNPGNLLELVAMNDLLNIAKEHYEMIFINCGDIKNSADVNVLLPFTNDLVIILNEGKVKRQVVKHLIAPLEQKNVNIIGVILNNCRYAIPEIIYKLT